MHAAGAGRLLRALHEAAAGFEPAVTTYQFHPHPPLPGEVVSHGGLGPWNTVYRDGGPVAFIDWDGAEPVDPKPGANTSNRYQTGASADPGIQHINVPDRCPRRVGNWCASRPLARGSNWWIDDRQMRAARLPVVLSHLARISGCWVTHHEHLAPPIVTTVVAALFCAPTTPW